MKYTLCPLCNGDMRTGSHWDCVNEMLADYVRHNKDTLGPRETDQNTKQETDDHG